MKTILILVLAVVSWYYYNKYQNLKKEITKTPQTTPTGDEPNEQQPTSVPEKQITDL